jgi:hypothetical protein
MESLRGWHKDFNFLEGGIKRGGIKNGGAYKNWVYRYTILKFEFFYEAQIYSLWHKKKSGINISNLAGGIKSGGIEI